MLNIDSYKQQVDETTKKVLHILDDPGWVEKEKKTGITFYTRSVAGSSFNQIKSVVTIPTTLDKLYEELKKVVPVNGETPKEKRDGFLERCILSEIDEQTAFYYIALETSSRFVLSVRNKMKFVPHREIAPVHSSVLSSIIVQ